MDGARETVRLAVVTRHTATPCAEVRIVVSSVEQVCRTVLQRDGAEESSHNVLVAK